MSGKLYYVCDRCGVIYNAQVAVAEGDAWECDSCGSNAAWEFTNGNSARAHAAHIQLGLQSGIFTRRP